MKSKSGFTIIEILVIVSVISILATIVVVSYNQYLKASRDDRRVSDIKLLAKSMNEYAAKNGNYPVTCFTGTSLANDCSNLGATYPSGTPVTIQPNATRAQFQAALPKLSSDFADPFDTAGASPVNKITAGIMQQKSYFVLSLDLIAGSFTQNFAGNAGVFTCSYTGSTSNYTGSVSPRPKNLLFAYYSDENLAWEFLIFKPSVDQNVLNWNTTNNPLCSATEFSL